VGKRGPRPEPTALRIVKGNPGKRPLPKHEPRPAVRLPPAPSWLTTEAKAEWKRTGEKLLRVGVMTETDTTALLVYCETWARWKDAQDQLFKFGPIVKQGKNGYLAQSPYLQIANKAMEQMLKLLVEFGMTPSSRSRVSSVKPAESEDPVEKWLNDDKRAH